MPTVVAEVTRGGIVESVHHGVIAVSDTAGEIVAAAGDPSQVVFFRSSAKPFQAIPVITSGAADTFGFTPAELALCCASHMGSRPHQVQVAAMLEKLNLDTSALRCGVVLPGDLAESSRVSTGLVPASPLQCDCSGKHSGMLAVCLRRGWDIETYLEPDHPLQREILGIMVAVMRVPVEAIVPGIDGCGLPTFGAPIAAFSTAFAALAHPEATPSGAGEQFAPALRRLAGAMVAHPANVSGDGELVADLMELGGGKVVAKSGAEGLLCLALPDLRYGVAIRILDGSFRAHAVIAAQVLRHFDACPADAIDELLARHDPALYNHNKRHVGDIRASFALGPSR